MEGRPGTSAEVIEQLLSSTPPGISADIKLRSWTNEGHCRDCKASELAGTSLTKDVFGKMACKHKKHNKHSKHKRIHNNVHNRNRRKQFTSMRKTCVGIAHFRPTCVHHAHAFGPLRSVRCWSRNKNGIRSFEISLSLILHLLFTWNRCGCRFVGECAGRRADQGLRWRRSTVQRCSAAARPGFH